MIAVASAAAARRQALILIQTLQLQKQYERDFPSAELMMGRSHFSCVVNNQTADHGPCTAGLKCDKKGQRNKETNQWIELPECAYFLQKAKARMAPISIQNYAYWLRETNDAEVATFGKYPWIICDEAHDLDNILMQAAVIEISALDLADMGVTADLNAIKTADILKRLATFTLPKIDEIEARAVEKLEAAGIGHEESDHAGSVTAQSVQRIDLRIFKTIRRLRSALSAVQSVNDEEWVFEAKNDIVGNYTLFVKPIFGKYGFKRIYNAASEKLVLMSAFLAPRMLIQTLGIDPDDCEIIEAPPAFDRRKSPILFTPVMKFNARSSDADWKFATRVMEEMSYQWRENGQKGLIHVPSLTLRNQIRTHWKIKKEVVTYEASSPDAEVVNKEAAIAAFKAHQGSAVLIGQSTSTGLDLPHVPTFQFIPKLWFLPTTDAVIIKRDALDPTFSPHYTICQIVQACGRIKRAQDHDGPTMILDESFKWFYAKHKQHFPKWFRDAYNPYGWDMFKDIKTRLPRIAALAGTSI